MPRFNWRLRRMEEERRGGTGASSLLMRASAARRFCACSIDAGIVARPAAPRTNAGNVRNGVTSGVSGDRTAARDGEDTTADDGRVGRACRVGFDVTADPADDPSLVRLLVDG